MTPKDQAARGAQDARAGEPRVAVLVLGCLLTVYDRCIKIIRATWGSTSVENVDVFYVYGGQSAGHDAGLDLVDVEHLICQARPHLRDGEAWVSGDIILCGAADVREGQQNCILRKRLIAFDYLANQRSYDFVYTVCASSYVDVDTLRRYVSSLPSTGVYHGALHVDPYSGYPFVSGASFLISKDIAADLARNRAGIISSYPDHLADDVVVGHYIATKHGRQPVTEIARRIQEGVAPTDDQTFVMPYGNGSLDFVTAPPYSHARRADSYHYHFNSRRMWEMEHFHRRFFAA